MLNAERLAQSFRSLVVIPSVSRREGALAADLRRRLDGLGADTVFDASAAATGSDTGNLIARLRGNCPAPPLLLSAHMDTVQPGEGIRVLFKDGVFTSDGTTIGGRRRWVDHRSALQPGGGALGWWAVSQARALCRAGHAGGGSRQGGGA